MFREELLEKGIASLKDHLRRAGFASAEVELSVITEKDSPFVTILIEITEGPPSVIKEVRIVGSSQLLRRKVDIEPNSIYDEKEIRRAIKKLREALREEGYYGAEVGKPEYEDGILMIPVNMGIKTVIQFKGNSHFNNEELKRIVDKEASGEMDRATIEMIVETLTEFYKKRGYIDVQVAPVVKEKTDVKEIIFFINEGKRYRVRDVIFTGGRLDRDILLSVVSLKEGVIFREDLTKRDRESILALYRGLGYRDVRVEGPIVEGETETATVRLTYRIEEGSQYRIGGISVSGQEMIDEEEILKTFGIRIGAPYNLIDLLDGRKRILRMYRQRGYLDASVTIEEEVNDSVVSLKLHVSEGPMYRFGKIIVKGNLYTKPEVILREVVFKELDPLDPSLLTDLSRRLYQTGLFEDVDISLLRKEDHVRDVLVSVREARPGSLELTLGYGEYEGFRTALDLTYRNLWGMNRTGRVRLEMNNIKKEILLGYSEPYLFGEKINLEGNLSATYRREKNLDTGETRYRVREYKADLSASRDITRHLKGSLSYEYSMVKTFDVSPDIVLSEKDRGYLAISSITPGILYDTRDDPIDPHTGVLAGGSIKIASFLLFGETDFFKLRVFFMKYLELSDRLVLALSLKTGIAQGYRDTVDLPVVERFFLGGRNSVRGFSQDSIGPLGEDGTPTGGNAFFQGNLEVRTDVGKGLGIILFLDSGNVWRRIDDIDMTLRYSAGVGLRYKTPMGPLRIDYGHKLDRRPGESAGEIHFSLGHAF